MNHYRDSKDKSDESVRDEFERNYTRTVSI